MISRVDALAAMAADPFDVVVIGGGITGAGVALDAASRGYSVALVERDDYAVGTSSRSSKMVHGGLRYLEQLDLGLVREALLERQLMVQLAPHLVHPTPFLIPSLGEDRQSRRLGLGLNMYDVMATTRVGFGRRQAAERRQAEDYWAPDRHRTIDGEEVVKMVPALAAREPNSAYLFYDCQTDDVRLVLTILGEAERFGAVMANGCKVTGILEKDGKVNGVACEAQDGGKLEIQAERVVNATGVWADRISAPGADAEDMPRIAPSRGSHLLFDLEDLAVGEAACIIPAGEGRTIFALPWYGRALVGTTDNDYEGNIEEVQPGAEDVFYLLEAVNSYFQLDLAPDKIVGGYAGVRPLISTGDPQRSVDISRKAELYDTESGMLTITGGKLTTWRRMAKDVVDRLVERDGREAPCRTAEIQLGMTARPEDLDVPEGVELSKETLDQLAFRYGHAAERVLEMTGEYPELAKPIVPGRPDIMAEVSIAARDEQARSVADVLLRRTRLGILAAPQLRDADSVYPIAEELARELRWRKRDIRHAASEWLGDAEAEGVDPALDVT